MPHTKYALVVALLWGGLTAPAWGQDVSLLECAQVAFFGPACIAVAPVAPPAPAPQEEPLFPPQSMAPDTPPLMYKLLEEPSLENAKAFLDWQQRRQARVQQVQQWLHLLAPQPGEPRP